MIVLRFLTVQSKNYLISSAQEFKNNFNSFSKTYKLGLRITKLNIQQGDANNTFTYILSKQVGLVGTINKTDNSLISISMVGQGNGSLQSGVDIIATMTCIIGAVDTSLSATERKSIMDQLGFFTKNVDLYNLTNQTTVDGIRYFINSSYQVGIICGAELP